MVITVVRTCEITTVFPSKAVFTVAGAIVTSSPVVTVIRTDEFGTVEARPWFVTDTLILHAASAAQTVVKAVGLGAVLTNETFLTEAGPIDTVAKVTAVQQAELNTAVIPAKALKAFTFAFHTATLVLAVVGTLGFGAVGTFPSRLTYAAAGFSTPVPTTTTVGLCRHFAWRNKRKHNKVLYYDHKLFN